MHAFYMILADRFTLSPITEYSLRLPLVPTTPANTRPVPMPMLHLQSYFSEFNINIYIAILTQYIYIYIYVTQLLSNSKRAQDSSHSIVLMCNRRQSENDDQRGSLIIHEELIQTAFIHVHTLLNVLNDFLYLIESLITIR